MVHQLSLNSVSMDTLQIPPLHLWTVPWSSTNVCVLTWWDEWVKALMHKSMPSHVFDALHQPWSWQLLWCKDISRVLTLTISRATFGCGAASPYSGQVEVTLLWCAFTKEIAAKATTVESLSLSYIILLLLLTVYFPSLFIMGQFVRKKL